MLTSPVTFPMRQNRFHACFHVTLFSNFLYSPVSEEKKTHENCLCFLCSECCRSSSFCDLIASTERKLWTLQVRSTRFFPCMGSKRAISQDGHILPARVANQNTKLAHIDRGRLKLYDNSSYCLFLNFLGSDVKMIVHCRNFPMEGQKSEENYARPRNGPELHPRQRKWVRGIKLKCNRLKVSKF